MTATTKKCPMCAETIPLAAAACEFCGAQFEVTITGYCDNCHQVRDADPLGCCTACSGEIIDLRVESKFIEQTNEPIAPPQLTETATLSPSLQRAKGRIWLLGVGAVMVVGIITLAFIMVPKLAPVVLPDTATVAPSLTSTILPSFTPTSTSTQTPSVTPPPPPTETPIPGWVNEYADLVIVAIKDRPPDFEEDFNDAQGWEFTTQPDPENGSIQVIDGALQMNITSGSGSDESGFANNSELRFASFVLQVDVDLSRLGQGGSLDVYWRGDNQNHGAVLSLSKTGQGQIMFCGTCSPVLGEGRRMIYSPRRVQITIISKYAQYAVYIDGRRLSYVDDAGRPPGDQIRLSLWVGRGEYTSIVRYDNLRIWDITNIQIP
jgi:hypothetical protein